MSINMTIYLPEDRLAALISGQELPERTKGSVIFADISGFTNLTETLTRQLGARRGAEELSSRLNTVYTALITEVSRYNGSVLSFAGDAITCWFDEGNEQYDDAPARAVACALGMQRQMERFTSIKIANGNTISLSVKTTVATGEVRRFVVGDPAIQLFDTIAGGLVVRVAAGGDITKSGEVLADEATITALGDAVAVKEWRGDADMGRFGLLDRLDRVVRSSMRLPATSGLTPEQLRPWLMPEVFARLDKGQGDFLTELRPAVSLFLRFRGIDFEHDPEAGQKLDQFIRRVQQIVSIYAGYIMQVIIGDKGSYLYVVFGAPIAHEDDAQRAVTAAVDLVELHTELAFISPLQIGISLGMLRTGAYGGATRKTYGVLGSEVNVSARLMGLAKPGEVLATGRVERATDATVTWHDLSLIKVKGIENPIPVHKLIANQTKRTTHLLNRAAEAPLVGREREMAVIDEAINQTKEDHTLHVVMISSDPGLGKSRLLDEAIINAKLSGLRVFGGSCESFSTNMAYFVWRTIAQQLFGMSTENDISHIEPSVRHVDPSLVERIPLLSQIFNIDIPDTDFTKALDPENRQAALHAFMIAYVNGRVRIAQEHGSAFFVAIEDIHWIDSASLDLLEALVMAEVQHGFMLCATYRPDDIPDEYEKRLEALTNIQHIHLDECTPDIGKQIIESRFKLHGHETIPQDLINRLLERAEGNPFYLEELVSYLLHRGIDLTDSSAYLEMYLPESLHILVLSRLDQVTERQRITLKVASIIGRLFRSKWLHGYYPALGELEQVRSDLDNLSELRITIMDEPEPDVAYLFKHIITQEVTYESLPFSQRADLHERLAGYLELLDPSRYVDLIAYHYQRTKNIPKQRQYLRLAGEAAADRYANVEALRYLSAALEIELEEHRAERFDLLSTRETVYHRQGERDLQLADIDTLASIADQIDDNERRARVIVRRAKYLSDIGQNMEAVVTIQRALSLVDAASELHAEALLEWGLCLIRLGEYEEADRILQRSYTEAETAYPAIATHCLINRGKVAGRLAKWDEGRDFYHRALEQCRTSGDRVGESTVILGLGAIGFLEGDWSAARLHLLEALPILRQIGQRKLESATLNNLGIIADDQGDIPAAIEYLEQALAIKRATRDRKQEAGVLINLGDFERGLGNYVKAKEYTEQALAITRETRDRQYEALAHHNLGLVAHFMGDLSQAATHYDAALKLRREIGDQVGECETLAYMGLLQHYQGNQETAREQCQSAIEIANRCGAKLEQAAALTHLGHVHLNLNEASAASETYKQAYELRQNLGLTHRAVESLAGMAMAAKAAGDHTAAVGYVQDVLEHFSNRSYDGLDEPVQVCLACYEVLKDDKDNEARSKQVLTTGHTILDTRAKRFSDEATRKTFLEEIPYHQRLREYYRSTNGSDA